MDVRPRISGRSRTTCRSKRPGRRRAGSSTSGRLVAAMTITLVFVSKPSISTRIWFSVCSRSSCEPPRPAPRYGETRLFRRFHRRKRCRDCCAWPVQTGLVHDLLRHRQTSPQNSEPLILKNGTPASPATAPETSVLPVPGGPTRSNPLGMRAPRATNFSGYFRKRQFLAILVWLHQLLQYH